MAVRRGDLLQGTLDLLVLKVLGTGPNHGYGIATRLHQLSDDALRVEEGSLYPALYRMEEQGLINAEWRPTENNRTAKFYALTLQGTPHSAGRARQLAAAVRRRHAGAARARTEGVTWPCDRRASFAASSPCSNGARGIETWSARWRFMSIRSHATTLATG